MMNYRQASVLRDLISADGFVTSESLAQKYSVSTKTIYSDLSFLNEEVTGSAQKIEKIPRRGVRLNLDDKERKQLEDFLNGYSKIAVAVTEDIPREYFLLKQLFFEEGEIDILDWSVDFYVSETSVRRDIDKLEQRFVAYDFKLERHQGKYHIVGKEQEIRKFLRNYLVSELHPLPATLASDSLFAYFFPNKEAEKIVSILDYYVACYHFTIGEQYRIYLLLDLLIARMRYAGGHVIQQNDELSFVENLSSYEVYTFADDLLREAIQQRNHQFLPSAEITNLSYSLLSVGYETNGLIIGSQMNRVVINLIKRVSQLLSLDLSTDDHLMKMLLSHIQPMIFRLKNKIWVSNDITEEIKKKYSVLYNIVWLSCRQLSEVFAIEITDGEIAFLTIHFEIAIEKLARPLIIYVVCPQGLATGELIMASLSRIISSFDHLLKIDSKELTLTKIKQADMIISSISLPGTTDVSKFIFISPILTDTDLQRCQQRYSQLLKGNRRMLSVIEDREAYIKSLIQKLIGSNVYLGVDKRTVESCIDFLVEKSAASNRRRKCYRTSILDRERLGSTSVYTGIALPHAEPAAVRESQLVMLTLKKPIRWGSNMVKVIMLISMSEEDESLYKDALISLYFKIDNSDYIDRLWMAQTPAEFLDILQESSQ